MKNRTIIIKVLAALLALSLFFSFAGCKNGGETADVQKLVEEIAVDYGTYGDEAKDRINTLLKELSAADANTGARWSEMFQAGALIELSGDVETAFEIYYDNYDIHELPPLG